MTSKDGRSASLVGAGILLTRALGFVRERLFAHFFADGVAADAFRAALRIPNVIRNLLGEGTLSASFIPVYAGMIERGEHERARQLSSVIASLLVLLTAVSAIVGIILAPVITDFAAPGFDPERRALTVRLVEIMFPMSGVMILSAWCLGILNTHRRFFLSYAAPAVWNIAQITTLIALGGTLLEMRLVVALAWGALIGSLLQVAVQLPATLSANGLPRWSLAIRSPGVQRVIRAWLPVVFGAGVYQISSIIDTQLASLLDRGAVAIMGYAQLVAILPVSLFGVSVAAVALPELSRDAAGHEHEEIRARLAVGTRRVGYFAIPAAMACAVLSEPIIASLFQTGAFGTSQTAIAAGVLSAYSIGIPAQASVKLFASGHYALGDTRTPVRIAALSVVVSAGSAIYLMRHFGPAGIALGAAMGAWVNVSFNFAYLRRRVGAIMQRDEQRYLATSIVGSVPAAALAFILVRLTEQWHLWASTGTVLVAFVVFYLGMTRAAGHPEARAIVNSVLRPPR